jgi:hypothetical protein
MKVFNHCILESMSTRSNLTLQHWNGKQILVHWPQIYDTYVTGLGAVLRTGTHVSCATRQESTVCLCKHLRSLLFDLCPSPCFIYIISTPSLM